MARGGVAATAPSVAAEAARRLGVSIRFDPAALAGFTRRMPDLFLAEQQRIDPSYQPLLYTIEHDHGRAHLDRIDDAFGVPHPQWTDESAAQAIAVLDAMAYPDTMPLGGLRGVAGLSLAHVARYLHFFHHTYPLYDAATCRGLARLGVDVPHVKDRDPTVYGLFVAAIERLKEDAPFWSFPEYNVSLQRVVQGALAHYGRG